MTRDEVIDKIKKLLRMKRGGTAGEIENALALAAKLAREHGINLDSVDPDESTQSVRHVEDALKSRLPLAAKYAAAILVNFFNVAVVIRRGQDPCYIFSRRPEVTVVFVGTDWDIEIARYVFGFLQEHFSRAWAQRKNRRLQNRKAFLDGMFLGLASKLATERDANQPSETAVVLVGNALRLREDYIKQHWPKCGAMDLERDKSGASASKYAGIQAGEKTNIRRAVDKPAAPARAALPPTSGQMQLM